LTRKWSLKGKKKKIARKEREGQIGIKIEVSSQSAGESARKSRTRIVANAGGGY